MKKLLFIIATLFSMNMMAQEQGYDNGLEVKFQVGLGNKGKYGLPQKLVKNGNLEGYSAMTTFGGTLANRWYLAYPGNCGLALQVKWVEFNGGKGEYNYTDQLGALNSLVSVTQNLSFLNIDALGLGAIFSIYLNTHTALDVKYDVAPSLLAVGYKGVDYSVLDNNFSTGDDKDDTHYEKGLGASQTIGLALRYRLLEIGAEYKIFNPKHLENSNEDEVSDIVLNNILEKEKYNANKFRVFIGLKF